MSGPIDALVALMLSLSPHARADRTREVAGAIAQASATREDAAILVTMSWYENRFEPRGVPFGLVSWRRRYANRPLEDWARAALGVYGLTARCGDGVATRLGWFHTGRCRADAFSTREARTVRELLASLSASDVAFVGAGASGPGRADGRRRVHARRRHHRHRHVHAAR